MKQLLRRTPSLRPATKKVIRPTRQGVLENPRSRSARLRVAERVG